MRCTAGMDENNVNSSDAVLLNSFVIRGKRCRVYLHRGILVWETERPPYTRCSLSISDVLAVHPVHQSGVCCSESIQQQHPPGSAPPMSPGSPLSPSSPPAPVVSGVRDEWRKASEASSGSSPPCHVAFTIHYAEPGTKNKWRHQMVTLKHTDPRQVASWVKTIRNFLKGFKCRPKRLLIFVNPFGGKKRGMKIYQKQMAPLLALAGVYSTVVVTEAPHHAQDVLLATPVLDSLDGVACVGGDGTFAEVLNGLVLRTAKDAALNPDDTSTPLPAPKLRVGVVPGGSTDTVAFCLHGTNDVQTAVLHIILGDERGMDLCSVHSNGNLLRFSASVLSYGYLGDVIRDSEKFRWMGPRRYDYSGFKKFLANRGYEGELRLRICSEDEGDASRGPRCQVKCQECHHNQHHQHHEHDKEEWRTVRGRFFMVNGANLSCACPRSPNGIAPFCHAGNGCVDIVLIQHTSILNNIRLLLRLGSSTRTLYDLPFVEVHRAHEFSFCAMPDVKESCWNCDGEVLLNTNVQVRVHRQLVKVFARGLLQDSKNDQTSCNVWC